ncbi:MAG: LLM class flavin-dependent oxidoreductase [Methanomicrobiales archaeon]|jgi:G6PDH family F420-dependent oxidoreductase|nr:LLM class flavin-dependent oxidoreductase [Burkholderiaceae bacterium]NLH25483.1 LLM class flavin-dependent oxidoreductase [Methanomicrobiales archaeon]HNB02885.1 LLM class flavin-dependent oxidoreductase [Methanoregulaceae archaeon]HNJ81303.1 LLM class flavin-dependent oxidoreductase [Methanoregulaceae archaeon]HNO08087.1 LLM class flavin-dependent oxidoreductase [Methanoregulaceae archaeon]
MKTKFGYSPSIERSRPADALNQAVLAEKMGFGSVWVDDHFLPVPHMTECGFAWTWMSSALEATERVFFATAVTAPIMRYNPAIVAHAFATLGSMYPGRVGIGVGSGEELNETAVVRGAWPTPGKRLEMLEEALKVMSLLWGSTGPITFEGSYYSLTNATLFTRPPKPIPVYFSAIGPRASRMAGLLGDHLITVARDPKILKDVIIPNFEAGAREAGKDPATMERALAVLYFYDPEHLVDPEAMKVSASEAKIEVAGEGSQMELWHSPEDIIGRIEEWKRLGFDHLIFGNFSADCDAGLRVFDKVLPHVD